MKRVPEKNNAYKNTVVIMSINQQNTKIILNISIHCIFLLIAWHVQQTNRVNL